MNSNSPYKNYKRITLLSCGYFGGLLIIGTLTLLWYLGVVSFDFLSHSTNEVDDVFFMNYDVAQLNDSKQNKTIKYGFELFQNTAEYIGPDNGNPEKIYSGNRLSCNNCHLLSGTKPYAAPLIGVINRFPQYRGRENKIGSIEERINGCFERSMNGKILPLEGDEMTALVAYLKWLNRYAPEDGNIKGQGFVELKIPHRAVNLEHGKMVYNNVCVKCHGIDGKGVILSNKFTYQYPPLWGNDSYNNGAGMNRVITSAQFIKANMPFDDTYEALKLTDEEAYDVAGYINQMQRPIKTNLERDFPDLLKKPVSTPYPPYEDPFSIEQHQKGPFQPIIEFYKKTYNITKTK
jgi:thiosulfate dehydrogenase